MKPVVLIWNRLIKNITGEKERQKDVIEQSMQIYNNYYLKKIYNNRTYHTSRRNSTICIERLYALFNYHRKKINTKFYAKYALKWQLKDRLNWNKTRPSHAMWHKGFQDSEKVYPYISFVKKYVMKSACSVKSFF